MDYYFQDNLRWSLGFETPNQAGAFLAVLLPLCWVAITCLWNGISLNSSNWLLRLSLGCLMLGLIGTECWLWWALAKTYSRGAWAGLALGAATWGALTLFRRFGPSSAPTESLQPDVTGTSACILVGQRNALCIHVFQVLARVIVVAGCLFASQFSTRLSPDYTLSDRSALNRVDLWKGGLELIAASPWRGWGWGESGSAFMQWTQPLDRAEGYKSMVNSYLTVAVEAGLPAFTGLLALMFVPLALGAWLLRSYSGWRSTSALGLVASWTAWMGCIFFSNLWIIHRLWFVPAAIALALIFGYLGPSLYRWVSASRARMAGQVRVTEPVLIVSPSFRPALTHYLMISTGIAGAVGMLLGIAAELRSRSNQLKLTLEPLGIVRLEPRTPVKSVEVAVFPDQAVLGESYGHELRRWLLAASQPLALIIHPPHGPLHTPADVARSTLTAVIFGEQALRVPLAGRLVCLVHPLGQPVPEVSTLSAGSRVILAGIDPTGGRYAWDNWAKACGVTAEINQGLALDVRLRWPAVVNGFFP